MQRIHKSFRSIEWDRDHCELDREMDDFFCEMGRNFHGRLLSNCFGIDLCKNWLEGVFLDDHWWYTGTGQRWTGIEIDVWGILERRLDTWMTE